jgi:hypothetical protein
MDYRFTPEEVRQRAEEIYHRELRAHLETECNKGKIVVINTDDGSYAVAENSLIANKRLHARNTNANPEALFAMRIGHPHVYMFDEMLMDTKS